MKLSTSHIPPSTFAQLVHQHLERLRIDRYVTVSHSMGTGIQKWVDTYKSKSKNVGRVFVDPICFQLWTPDLAYNAVYRRPVTSHQWILTVVAMKEPGIGVFLGRYFSWYLNCYFTHEVEEVFARGDAGCAVYVSQLDDLVDVGGLVEYFGGLGFGDRVRVMKGMRHGACFFLPSVNAEICEDLSKMIDASDASS